MEQSFGRLDVLVNNAAILYDTWQSAVDADLDVVNQALTTNLFGPWKLSQVCDVNGNERPMGPTCWANELESEACVKISYHLSQIAPRKTKVVVPKAYHIKELETIILK